MNKGLSVWDIWLAYIHFEDKPKVGKVRPVLLVAVREQACAVVKLTTVSVRPDTFDIPLSRWKESGLVAPTTARCDQIIILNTRDILRSEPLGRLQPTDFAPVTAALIASGNLARL
jgi:mRNA-degrading endonuclease toxin of MazEF toxin-antitoxin module